MITTKWFKTKEEAEKYLLELLNKKYFKEKGIDYINRITKVIKKGNAMKIRQSANYWKDNESLRKSLGESIE